MSRRGAFSLLFYFRGDDPCDPHRRATSPMAATTCSTKCVLEVHCGAYLSATAIDVSSCHTNGVSWGRIWGGAMEAPAVPPGHELERRSGTGLGSVDFLELVRRHRPRSYGVVGLAI
jgi:hypothetical protein